MSKNVNKKKSTKKKSKFETSRLIPIIAIVEVVVLIAVATLAWFFMAKNKKLSSGIITVQADSGLEIDFNDADKSTYIDIFNYIDRDTFHFEPATSIDGRNIFFPTSGTFGNDETQDMVFREGTVNDINSKYINIDFELTNNSDQEMDVFLSNNSRFLVTDDNNNKINGKALRLAFYNNDGNSGKVDSSFANKFKSADVADSGASDDPDEFTVYFYLNKEQWNSDIHAYLYDSTDETANTETIDGKTIKFDNSGYDKAWPGQSCSHVSGNIYSFTFSNPYKTKTVPEVKDGVTVDKVYKSSSIRRYDKLMFNDGGSNKVTLNSITNNYIYHNADLNGVPITFKTLYFLKPSDWAGETPKCAIYYQSGSTTTWFGDTNGNGESMKKAGTGVFSYTFPVDANGTAYTHAKFIDSDTSDPNAPATAAITDDGALYYFPDTDVSGVSAAQLYTVSNYSDRNLYFYNSKKWTQPYANINALADAPTAYTYSVPMIDLTGGLYYIEVPSVFMYDDMSTKTDAVGSTTIDASGLADNCQVYFSGKNKDGTEERTESKLSKTNYIYTPSGDSSQYSLTDRDYSSELDITDESYAVISPGVSAGFQRNANPIKTINTASGVATEIVPTFASAFDDYIMGSNNPVFKIEKGKTVNMSMVIWLEGTDEQCVDTVYAGKNINLYLEFSTVKAMDASDETYTYRFIDSTEEIWTSDTVTNVGGVEVNPVMQMYDVDAGRGYIMSGKSYSTYGGKNKVRDWECLAPQSILNSGHDIEFRRVNPYNEDEIWNVWQAGNISTYSEDSFDAKTRVVSFTAFADGAPDYSYHSQFEGSNIPEKSCGGVWGNVETQMLYLYDGRKTRNIEDTMGGDGECGYLFCNYEYRYPNSDETVTLEYKGSSHYNAFFSFVVPTSIYTQSPKPSITFPNYVMLKDYASNAVQQQGKITQRNIYNAGQLGGQFYELNTANNGSAYEHSYWGSDVIYVQAKNTLSRSFTNAFAFYQIYFHGTGGTQDFYSYMYENNNYKSGDSNNSFVAVVPNNGAYNSFHFEAAKHSSHSDKIRYDLGTHDIESSVDETTGLRLNTVKSVATGNDGRILTLDWDYAKILYKNSWSDGNYNGDNITVHYGTNGGYTYKLRYMTKDSNNAPIYEAYVESNHNDVYFQLDNNTTRSASFSVQGKDAYLFEPKTDSPQWNDYSQFYLKVNSTSYDGNNNITSGTYNKVGTTQNNNDSWPEYKPKSVLN